VGRDRVVLVGMMGSGKSTVASVIGRATGWPVRELDDDVADRLGKPVARIFAEDGEHEFRRAESIALTDALALTPVVVSTGGGVIEDAENRRAIARAGALVVWLDAGDDVLLERVGTGDSRPLLAADVPAALRRLREQREGWYREVADIRIDTAGRTPETVAELVLGALEDRR
jgi:shikimate kinase